MILNILIFFKMCKQLKRQQQVITVKEGLGTKKGKDEVTDEKFIVKIGTATRQTTS